MLQANQPNRDLSSDSLCAWRSEQNKAEFTQETTISATRAHTYSRGAAKGKSSNQAIANVGKAKILQETVLRTEQISWRILLIGRHISDVHRNNNGTMKSFNENMHEQNVECHSIERT